MQYEKVFHTTHLRGTVTRRGDIIVAIKSTWDGEMKQEHCV
jgi:hypothetical protein